MVNGWDDYASGNTHTPSDVRDTARAVWKETTKEERRVTDDGGDGATHHDFQAMVDAVMARLPQQQPIWMEEAVLDLFEKWASSAVLGDAEGAAIPPGARLKVLKDKGYVTYIRGEDGEWTAADGSHHAGPITKSRLEKKWYEEQSGTQGDAGAEPRREGPGSDGRPGRTPAWNLQPILDDSGLAEKLRATLEITQPAAEHMARETLEALNSGRYRASTGAEVDWSGLIDAAKSHRLSIPADEPLPTPSPGTTTTSVTIGNMTTLDAAKGLIGDGGRPLALNFANGAKTGGGWLTGALAQEEYLCRSSGLYATIQGDPMYARHRARSDRESTHSAILSPDVPVHRDDSGTKLETPWLCDFITMAAPVAWRVGQARSRQLMAERIDRLLQIAAANGYQVLVLGAWGCGAFRNDPDATADAFAKALEGPYAGVFALVVFAIADWSPQRKFLRPFARRFDERTQRV